MKKRKQRSKESLLGDSGFGDIPRGRHGSTGIVSSRVIRRLYKSLERPMVSGTGPAPNQVDMVAFWRSLWSEPVNHNEGPWTEVVASQCTGIKPMDPVIITPDDVAEVVRRAPNWKSPELDGLASLLAEGVHGVSRCARPTVSRGSQPEVAPKPLHYWDHSFGS
ncbi:unnamed protein product [Parnassius apollo]|uniref:(apollo) hypothetical protein n=1 Tax=Parnassius apollo TaxID=110799 RepID=A0A8S3X150_PARAO|nr:unnamed protein product [Parnassius apollo]